MKITSASASTLASDGTGSNVCEFVPSGTMPVMATLSPPMLAAIDVIGATVVTTFTLPAAATVRRRGGRWGRLGVAAAPGERDGGESNNGQSQMPAHGHDLQRNASWAQVLAARNNVRCRSASWMTEGRSLEQRCRPARMGRLVAVGALREDDGDVPRPADLTAGPRDRASGSRRNSGMRASHSSTATRSSMRARFEPAQRWMPAPKATWRLSWRSMITWSASGNASGSRLAAGKLSSTRSPVVHGAARHLDVARHDASHGDRRVGAEQLLDRRRHQLGLGDQATTIVGVGGEVPQRGPDGRPRRVDAGDQGECRACRACGRRGRARRRPRLEQLADEVVRRVGVAVRRSSPAGSRR